MKESGLIRVAVLIDLPRTPQSGGHVKCWERLAAAAGKSDLPLDLTVYFSGRAPDEILGPHARVRHLPPVFSTANLKFLPYVPDHTDLAPYHPQLARELAHYDVIHTTDGFFAYSRTAARVSRTQNIPLMTSIHTDTPSYARIFTRHTIEKLFGRGWLGRTMIESWRLPERQERTMRERLHRHLQQCRFAHVTRAEDQILAESILGHARVHQMRRGVDKDMFGPHRRDREGIERDYNIPSGRIVLLFVGRVDIGKNIYTLVAAMKELLARGYPLHLIVAGQGPAEKDVREQLGDRASVPGFIAPAELARLYASADLLAVPSEVEIHSMVGMEAIASGCPAMIAGKSGIAKLFANTPAVREVESGVEAWAAVLQEFAADVEKQKMMRAAAAEYGRAHLVTWREVLADDLFTVWQQAASREPVAREAV